MRGFTFLYVFCTFYAFAQSDLATDATVIDTTEVDVPFSEVTTIDLEWTSVHSVVDDSDVDGVTLDPLSATEHTLVAQNEGGSLSPINDDVDLQTESFLGVDLDDLVSSEPEISSAFGQNRDFGEVNDELEDVEDREPGDRVYHGIEARRIDAPSGSRQKLMQRPGIKVQKNKYQKVQSTSSEEEDVLVIGGESRPMNMRVGGVSKDIIESPDDKLNILSPSLPKPSSVAEKLIMYKQKPSKKNGSRYEKTKIPYSKPIMIKFQELDDSQEEDRPESTNHENMRIIGVSSDDPVSKGPDLLTSQTQTVYTKRPMKLFTRSATSFSPDDVTQKTAQVIINSGASKDSAGIIGSTPIPSDIEPLAINHPLKLEKVPHLSLTIEKLAIDDPREPLVLSFDEKEKFSSFLISNQPSDVIEGSGDVKFQEFDKGTQNLQRVDSPLNKSRVALVERLEAELVSFIEEEVPSTEPIFELSGTLPDTSSHSLGPLDFSHDVVVVTPSSFELADEPVVTSKVEENNPSSILNDYVNVRDLVLIENRSEVEPVTKNTARPPTTSDKPSFELSDDPFVAIDASKAEAESPKLILNDFLNVSDLVLKDNRTEVEPVPEITARPTTTSGKPSTDKVTYARLKFSKRPYLKTALVTTNAPAPALTNAPETTVQDIPDNSRKPIKRFSMSQLNFTRGAAVHRRTPILSTPSSQNDILPLENFWDDDVIQKWKNLPAIYADYGKRELKMKVMKDAKRVRYSVGDVLHDFSNLTFPVNRERLCRVRKVQLVIVIFSLPGNILLRNGIRQTWLKDLNITESDEMKYFFLLPRNDDISVQQEQRTHGDIIQSLANKNELPIAVLKWLTDYCPRAQLVLKLEDDVILNVDNFLNSVKRITDFNAIYGLRSTHLITDRGEDGLDTKSWPWQTLPPYLETSMLLIGGEAIPKLLGAAQTLPQVRHEGIYLTSLCAQHAGVKRYIYKRFFGEKRDFKISNCVVEYLDAFRVPAPEFFQTIHETLKRVKFENQKCFGTIDCVENVFGVCVSLHEIL